jgi:predicted NUDIX family NTP pyrophosphohydrolase
LTRRHWPAIRSISNGRPEAVGDRTFPNVDRAEWFDIEFARTKMLSGQMELLDRHLAIAGESAGK